MPSGRASRRRCQRGSVIRPASARPTAAGGSGRPTVRIIPRALTPKAPSSLALPAAPSPRDVPGAPAAPGARTKATPKCLARRRATGRNVGRRWRCWWLSRWVTRRPASTARAICASHSRSSSWTRIRPAAAAEATEGHPCRNRPSRRRDGTSAGGETGRSPPTTQRWTPVVPIPSWSRARAAAAKASPLVRRLVSVTSPRERSPTIASDTGAVSPRSSAFRTRRITGGRGFSARAGAPAGPSRSPSGS